MRGRNVGCVVLSRLLLWSSCLLGEGALGKELMRSRCSACEAMAVELQEWFYPDSAPKAFKEDKDLPQSLSLSLSFFVSLFSQQLDLPNISVYVYVRRSVSPSYILPLFLLLLLVCVCLCVCVYVPPEEDTPLGEGSNAISHWSNA